jgi:hypothetical protein
MAYSPDGINWTRIPNNTFASNQSIWGLAYGNGVFVAAGENGRMAWCSW